MRQEYRATYKYAKMSAQKMRLVADQIRGLPLAEADAVLQFSDKRAATMIRKTLKSARSNALQAGKAVDESRLFVSRCFIDKGPQYNTWLPRSKGSATPLIHRSSHVTVCVSEKES